MNDPHVKALRYNDLVGNDVDYDNAPPLSATTDEFDFLLGGDTAGFEMRQHFSTADEAKAVVEPYIRAWHVLIGLEQDPGDLRLVYDRADIIDRSPDPRDESVVKAQVLLSAVGGTSAAVHVARSRYPSFPTTFCASPEAEYMYWNYVQYLQDRRRLADMAYHCLNTLEADFERNKRKETVKKYSIDYKVLDNLARLVSTTGGPTEARKRPKGGVFEPFRPHFRAPAAHG
jgi:hypothetical protein